MLSDTCVNFTNYLLEGTEPNLDKIRYSLDNSLMLVTALSPVIGYDKASLIAHHANDNNCSLKEANQHFKFISDEDFDKVLNPGKMTNSE